MLNLVNLCNWPPWKIASWEFNDAPEPIHLSGVRMTNRSLFETLQTVADPRRRGEIFHDFVSVKFNLHEWQTHAASARRNLRHSYVRFLHGWGIDSNSVEGAVLKAWVESRLGIPATFHRGKLLGHDTESDAAYAHDRMRGFMRTNAINSQLDLLYEFCQDELVRRQVPGPWLTLYRGTCDADEYPLLATRDRRNKCVRLNSLNSFTSDIDCAWEFGSTVWEVRVPLVKLFFFSGLLPNNILRGENEYLVIGGEYWVKELLY